MQNPNEIQRIYDRLNVLEDSYRVVIESQKAQQKDLSDLMRAFVTEQKAQRQEINSLIQLIKGNASSPSLSNVPLSSILATYARESYPDIYDKAVSSPDYDESYWSFSLANDVPVYSKNLTNNMKTRLKLLFNEEDYNAMSASSKSKYRTQYERLRSIMDPKFVPKGGANRMLANNAALEQGTKEIQMSRSQIRKNVKSQGMKRAIMSTEGKLMAQSLTVGQLRRLDNTIPGIQTLSERVFFYGIYTETEYVLNSTIFNKDNPIRMDEFKEIINRMLTKQTLEDTSDPAMPPIYSVHLWYTRPAYTYFDQKINKYIEVPAVQRRLPVFVGTIIENLQKGLNLEFSYEDAMVQVGSDSIGIDADLDMSRFIIQKIDIYRAGGNAILLRNLMAAKSGSKDHKVYTLTWCKLFDYVSTNNGCFMKIVSVVLKELGRKEYRTYGDLWKKVSPDTYGKEINFNQAMIIAKTLGLGLLIYNIDGEIVAKVEEAIQFTFRILYFEGHYMLIKDIFTTTQEPLRTQVNLTRPSSEELEGYQREMVFFDLETVYVNEAGSESNLRPYSISVNNFSKTLDLPTTDIMAELLTTIINLGPKKIITIIAYNGSGFDFIFLLGYLMRSGFKINRPPSTRGRIRNMDFWIDHLDNQWSFVKVWDPYLFVMRPLSSSANDFGINVNKLPFDHDQVQFAYLEGPKSFANFIENNRTMIEEYNLRDVEVLKLFTNKLLQTLSEITTSSADFILSCPTLPSLCYRYWKSMISNNKSKIGFNWKTRRQIALTLPKAARKIEIDRKIRSATVGGRVEGKPGYYEGDFRMVDVVSLYPTVMKDYDYPYGKEILVTNVEHALSYINSNTLGLYHVSYDQENLSTEHSILPSRLSGRLLWDKANGTGWLPLQTCDQLSRFGVELNLVPDSDGLYAIVWECYGPLFKDYVNKLSGLKQEQDLLKLKKDPSFNPSLREMVKLMLNSLSGKVIQRNFKEQSELVQTETDLIKLLKSKPAEEWVKKKINIVPVTTNTAFVEYTEEDEYSNPMPSQLGVMIYANARAYMFDNVFSKAHVYYSDTDSAVITYQDYLKLPKELLVEGRDKRFGDLEVEGSFDALMVIAPKIYALYNKGKITKFRIKGVRDTDLFKYDDQWIPIAENVEKLFYRLAERFKTPGSIVEIKSWQFRKIISEGRLERRSVIKEV